MKALFASMMISWLALFAALPAQAQAPLAADGAAAAGGPPPFLSDEDKDKDKDKDTDGGKKGD
jgi:hypothetical protein